MKKALVYFTTFDSSFGGSEYRPLLFVAELQKSCEVTLALNWESDIARAARTYGVDIDFSRLRVVTLKPRSSFLRRLDSVIPVFSVRRLQRFARSQDVCISCANMVDFGRPGYHFIYLLNTFGDNAFNDYFLHRPPLTGPAKWKRRLRTFLAERFLRPLAGVRSARRMLADPRETFYVNSDYVGTVMEGFYGRFNRRFFYPPTIFEADASLPVERDPLKIVYIGRLTPMKGIREMILAVGEARRLSGLDLRFELAGRFPVSAYSDEIRALLAERPWVVHVGEKYGEEKGRFLRSGTFAFHACREEAFGIAIAEYLKCGVLPVVPDEGGSPEIAAAPELIYHDFDEAARRLAALATDAALRGRMTEHCRSRAALFTREAYFARQQALFMEILGER